MSKHTPGPWKWEEGTPVISRHWNGRDCAVAAVDWRTLVWHEDGNCAGRESGANARLIAAAPDMLETLKRLREMCADFGAKTACDMADAAIAKATKEAA